MHSKSDPTRIDHPADFRGVSLHIDYFTDFKDDSSHTDYLSDFKDSSHALLGSALCSLMLNSDLASASRHCKTEATIHKDITLGAYLHLYSPLMGKEQLGANLIPVLTMTIQLQSHLFVAA